MTTERSLFVLISQCSLLSLLSVSFLPRRQCSSCGRYCTRAAANDRRCRHRCRGRGTSRRRGRGDGECDCDTAKEFFGRSGLWDAHVAAIGGLMTRSDISDGALVCSFLSVSSSLCLCCVFCFSSLLSVSVSLSLSLTTNRSRIDKRNFFTMRSWICGIELSHFRSFTFV